MLFCSAPLSSFVSGAIQVSFCDCDCDNVISLHYNRYPDSCSRAIVCRTTVGGQLLGGQLVATTIIYTDICDIQLVARTIILVCLLHRSTKYIKTF